MPMRKARTPAVTATVPKTAPKAKPKAAPKAKPKVASAKKATVVNAEAAVAEPAVSLNRMPAAAKPEPVTLADHTISAAAWNVIRQVRHLHLWQARGRSCECKLCVLVKQLKVELERNGNSEPKDAA